jgi:hypothetical protein
MDKVIELERVGAQARQQVMFYFRRFELRKLATTANIAFFLCLLK